jgi:hypothetical protein
MVRSNNRDVGLALWLVEINQPGNGPQRVFPGRTREACEKWAEKFNKDVSRVRTSGPVKVARVISIMEMRDRKEVDSD